MLQSAAPIEETTEDAAKPPHVGLRPLLQYFLKLGAVGFGGPVALVGYMQRDLVKERGWYSETDFSEGLALAQLAPGPLAAQLAIYLGWLRSGVAGAIAVGVAFVLPSFLMVLAISALYLQFGGMSWMVGAFYGVGAAVIGIISRSAYKLVRSTLKKDPLLWGVFAVLALSTALLETEAISLVVVSGILTLVVRTKLRPRPRANGFALPALLTTGLKGVASASLLLKILAYFSAAGAFVFGSGLAVVPFLHGGVVVQNHWLTERQFVDAVAVAMITPGPVVITVAFIGYLVGGPIGGALAAIGVFLPCLLIVVLCAKHYRRWVQNQAVRAFVLGVTAAATGAIAGSVFVLGKRAIVDVPTAFIAAAALGILLLPKRIPEPVIVGAAALIGMMLKG
jgi:chromate transporter